MGRSTRKEAVVKLREQIESTIDPELLIRLTRQLTKLLPRPKSVMGRPRTAPLPDVSPESTYIPNGSAMDDLPLGEQTCNRLVEAIEKEQRQRGLSGLPKMTETEQAAFIEKTLKTFSVGEREALAALAGV